MEWARDHSDWPLAEHSRTLEVKPHTWHVQDMGQGPMALLLHGAGGSTHSWAGLLPLLARDYRAVAVDLPGQGFTRAGTKLRLGLPKMAMDIKAVLDHEGWQPEVIIGHSAGGALGLFLAESLDHPTRVIGINAALEPFDGPASWLFPMMAKMLALNPFTSVAFTASGSAMARARGLIRTTGSQISDESLRCYARLFSDRGHVDSTLQMMAQWDVDTFAARLRSVETPALLMAGSNDATVSPDVSRRTADRMANAQFVELEGLGHLAHEEDPDLIAQTMSDWL
ncbi:MAG: alpha/beta fold hydrolase BchO [Pseudomonadota bacterium]